MLAGGMMVQNQLFASLATKKLSIGIIGCGDRGTGIMKVMQELPYLYEINAFCDTLDFRLESARKIKALPASKIYRD